MMTSTITTAARQYANRPKDERFASVQALIDSAVHQKELSTEVRYNAKDLRAVAVDNDPQNPDAGTVMLASPRSQATFTHYSFGQLARSIGAPGAYLRGLPPTIAADCINHGLKHTPPATDLQLLAQRANGEPPKIRACTSETYGRVWDADLYSAVQRQIMQNDARWTTPPTWSGESAGAYRGDRDSFVIITNGGSIVEDPTLRNVATSSGGTTANVDSNVMYRGLMISNSEVGARSIQIEQILFRYICGNHMLWSAVTDKSFRRRHTGSKTLRDTMREIAAIAYAWTNQSTERDNAIIKSLVEHEIAVSQDAVIDELKKIGFTKETAIAAYETCEQTERVSPRSFWGIAQGATRLSQQSGYQDERFQLDMLAAKVLQRGRLQYA